MPRGWHYISPATYTHSPKPTKLSYQRQLDPNDKGVNISGKRSTYLSLLKSALKYKRTQLMKLLEEMSINQEAK